MEQHHLIGAVLVFAALADVTVAFVITKSMPPEKKKVLMPAMLMGAVGMAGLGLAFLACLALGVPIAVSIGIAAVLTMLLSIPAGPALTTAALRMATGIDSFALLAIPFFILSGQLISRGGMAQRLVDFAFGDLHWRTCCTYVDDSDVYTKGIFDLHVEHLRAFHALVRQAGLRLKPSKCKLARKELLTLGHRVSGEGRRPSEGITAAIVDYGVPTRRKQLESFLGMCSYVADYLPAYSKVAAPLRRAAKAAGKSGKLRLGAKELEAFEELKRIMASGPTLAHAQLGPGAGEFVVRSDASALGLGACLLQWQGGLLRPIRYASRVTQPAETRYANTTDTPRREALAIVFALETFRPLILNRSFQFETDHANLIYFRDAKRGEHSGTAGQLARWAIVIDEYQFKLSHRAGREMWISDALSRDPRFERCATVRHRSDLLPPGLVAQVTGGEDGPSDAARVGSSGCHSALRPQRFRRRFRFLRWLRSCCRLLRCRRGRGF